MRTRDEVRGLRSPERTDGGAVMFRLVLMSSFLSLDDHALLASYRRGSSVRVVGYGRALRYIEEIVAKERPNHDEFALHSLRIAAATVLTAGSDIFGTYY